MDNITNIGGLKISTKSISEWVDYFYSDLKDSYSVGEGKFFSSVNGNSLSQSSSNKILGNIMRRADGLDPDGMSIVIASRYLTKNPISERVVTTDFAQGVFERALYKPIKVFLLGGTLEENGVALEYIRLNYPNVNVLGSHGYIEDEDEIIKSINTFSPDLLLVGMGVPLEQSFCDRARPKLKVGWIKTCGGMFKVFSGNVSRPPLWVQNMGFEWLYRCFNEPRHVLLRYIKTNPHSVYLMFKYFIISKLSNVYKKG